MFKQNVGGIDRILRIALGLIMIVVGAITSTPWLYLGVIPLATGLFKFCGAYKIFGLNTCPLEQNKEQK